MNTDDCEVIVVGAGPTGLLSAILLARSGVRVRLFDKNPDQAHESRALAVQARTLEQFLALGLADEMLRRGTLVTRARMFKDGGVKVELPFEDIRRPDTPYPFILIIPQRETEAVLNDELRRLGVPVERSAEVTGFAQTRDGVTAQVRRADGGVSEVRGSYLVGADGAHSVARKVMGLSFEGAAYPQDFLLADCRVEGLTHPDGLGIFLHGTAFAVYLPLPDGNGMGRIITQRPGQNGDKNESVDKQGGKDVPLSLVEEAFRAATNLDVTLHDSIWTSLYRVHHRGVDRYGDGRAFVAGDAAHIHSPAAGQGMNTGLQDAANLAWKLALALRRPSGAPDGLLDTYHAERWPVGQRVLKVTDDMFTALTTPSGWVASLRNAIVPQVAGVLAHTDFARESAFNFLSELGIHYEPGAVVMDETGDRGHARFWKHGPACGHRAPNASYARHRDVFDLLTGYGFHVLALSRQPLSGEEIGGLCEGLKTLPQPAGIGLATHVVAYCTAGGEERIARAEAAEIFNAYGVDHETPQALYLVRPDGYIAWRADRFDLAGLTEFLRERF